MENLENWLLLLRTYTEVHFRHLEVPLYVFNNEVSYPPLVRYYIFFYIINAINLLSTITFVGLILLVIIGLLKKRPVPIEKYTPEKIVSIVTAHNEEESIGVVLDSLFDANFDEVYLVADACTDRTVEIAREKGVNVIELDKHSKSKALNEAIPIIVDKVGEKSFYMFFDAGNYVPKDFLFRAIPFIKSYPIIQFRTRNANFKTWVSRMFVIMSAFFFKIQEALNNIGLSAILSGFGWGAYGFVLKEYPYSCKSITDDFEYSLKVRYNIAYVSSVSVYDEKPEDFITSFKQRLRWIRGYFYEMFFDIRSFKYKPYFLFLPLSFLLWVISIVVLLANFHIITVVSSFVINSILFFFTLDNNDLNMVKFYDVLVFFFFNLTNLLVIFIALFTCRNTKWFRTPHKGIIATKV
ncbi:MAG: glycosyltransferase [Caldisericum exile]|uniref:glycosyltransferase n=1 Tax=Caldisericum exile TaxID=693075 RepID=UPI003C722248